jgi:hypothetical protein
MLNEIQKTLNGKPRVYYGLHFAEGVAEYSDDQGEYRIFVSNQTAKKMNQTFAGCHLYVNHVNEVDYDNPNPDQKPDGYVVESFFNQADGKHWAKFIVTSEAGEEAIRKGWTLSNAYYIKKFGEGGRWHNVEYRNEVLEGEFYHLSLVPNPRYEYSVVLTPEEFKEYNARQEAELYNIANSKGEESMLNLFKKTKVDNSKELAETMVTLPKSKVDMTLEDCARLADQVTNEKDEPKKCNMEDLVEVNGEEMTVKELVSAYNKSKKNEEDEAKKKEQAKNEEDEEEAENKKNEEDEEAENKKNKEDEEKQNALEAQRKKAEFEALKNAHLDQTSVVRIETGADMIARGKARYGSGR